MKKISTVLFVLASILAAPVASFAKDAKKDAATEETAPAPAEDAAAPSADKKD